MRTKFSGILTLLLAFVVQFTFAQEKTITGTVTDDTGLPLPGVNIVIKGTSTGTQSDFDGDYSLIASVGQTLVYTYVGFATQERAVTAATTTIDVQMQAGEELSQVVVTGFAVKREKKALGYAVSEIAAESIEQRSEGDLARVLSGKSSGVVITNSSGISGSATNINIRGYLSVNNSNQPLFIVDGVPISNDTNAVGNFLNGNSGSSRSLDIDPNNIANVSVLKGFAAATLYGSEGRNGVILITTKSGSAGSSIKKNEITVSQGVFFNEIASLPDYQNTFGNGFDGAFGNFYSNWGPGFYAEGFGGYLQAGSNVNPDGTIPHPYNRGNLADVFPQFQGVDIPWQAEPDNVKDFFRTGIARNTSVNVASGSDDGKYAYNLSFGHLDDEGFTPGNRTNRTTFAVGGKAELSNKFTVNASINFVRTDFDTPPVALSTGSGTIGTGLSVFSDIFYTPRNVPLMDLPFQNPFTGASVYYRGDEGIVNPNWTVRNSYVNQVTSRAFGSNAINYQINDNLSVMYRVGYDAYSERNEGGTNVGATSGPILGQFYTYTNTNMIWDHNLMLNGSYSLTDNLGMNFTVGATSRYEKYDRDGVSSSGQIVFDVFRHFNFREQADVQFQTYQNIVGAYGQVDFDYNNYLYLNLSARNDWVSNQIENSQFYPSASVSFIPTTAFEGMRSTNGFNYLKLRAGYGTSAGFASGFPTSTNLILSPRVFTPPGSSDPVGTNAFSTTLANPALRPELFEEFEVGFETRFLDNRVSLDFSYYNRTTTDLIVSRPLAPSTGYTSTQFNIGELEGYGFEADLGVELVRNEGNGFNWNVNTNYTKYRTTVVDLGLGDSEDADDQIVAYAGFTNLGNAAINGQPFSTMIGSVIERNEDGEPIVNSQGLYVIDQGVNIIGDATPDFLVNVSNNMSYRNVNFNFLLSYQHGGDIYSETIGTLLGRGLTTDTEDRLDTYILPGVKEDGTPNDIQINNSAYYFDVVGLQGPDELRVYDASVVRLNEISLGYDFPAKWLDRSPFGSVELSIAGYNLYYHALNTPDGVNFDPNIVGTGVGNGRGFDFLNGPSGKRYGFTVKAKF